jgi:UMF1 family MFS transporter
MAWALYDWAGAPFTTLILTFVMPVYFAQSVVRDAVRGQALWSGAVAISGLAIAVASPILGVFADISGRNNAWLFFATASCAVVTGAFWFVEPAASFTRLAMILIAIGNFAYVSGVVFNNAALPKLASRERVGRWSGWAWGFGYIGGLAALLFFLLFCLSNNTFGFDRGAAQNIRVAGPIAALWLLLFSWPRFAWTPDSGPPGEVRLRNGLKALRTSLRELAERPDVLRFLIANMLYADALVAIFTVGGIYAAGAIGMSLNEVTRFGIALNLAAGAGAVALSWLDDFMGARRTILFALVGLMISGIGAVWASNRLTFWIVGCVLGFFVGPAQAASRSFISRVAPPGRETEYFGLFALSGKATAFIGPIIVSLATWLSGSQRVGLASLIGLIAVGAFILWSVDERLAVDSDR